VICYPEKFIMFRFAPASVCFLFVLAACSQTPPPPKEQELPAPAAQQLESSMFSLQPDWRLTHLGGQKVSAGAHGAAWLRFTEDNRVTGYGSCNRIVGTYLREGRQIAFSRLASTRRACLTSPEIENNFFKALETARSWELTENGIVLRFYDADARLLLEMEATKKDDK
jgi:putative lipoprotein